MLRTRESDFCVASCPWSHCLPVRCMVDTYHGYSAGVASRNEASPWEGVGHVNLTERVQFNPKTLQLKPIPKT